MPKVTVIIPSYNHEKFVAEAIQSVLNQTYQDFEIVITDDGSTDKTVSIIKSFTDPRIKLFCFARNQGACVAANKCVSEARGELIAMLSSDDVFASDKLEKQVRFLEQNVEIGAVFSYAQIIDEDGNDFTDENHFYKRIFIQQNRTRFEWLNYFFFRINCLCHPSALIRKQCYDDVGKYDERFAQLPDFDFWVRLCMRYDIYILPENLVKFRLLKHEANASGRKPATQIRHASELSQILKKYLNQEICNNFLKIFPHSLPGVTVVEPELVPFFVAMLALQVDTPGYKQFGIETLYQVFSQKNIVNKIKEQHSFAFSDLLKLTGQHDVFGIIATEQLQQNLFQTQVELQNLKAQFERVSLEKVAADIFNHRPIKGLMLKPIKYPSIKPVPVGNRRPFWSVMIPTYNNTKHLEETLRSVLEQAPEADEMQIEVVDDHSTQGDVEAIVRKVDKGRVSFYRQPKNLGLAANWNSCIQRARGHWVHILHQDDTLLPGFYSRLREAVEKEPTVGAAFCRYINTDENGNWTSLGLLESETPGILKEFLTRRLAFFNSIRTPSVIVRRGVYEQLGGYLPELVYAVDWEMWKRIAALYPVWYEPQPLACYREHSSSETSRLVKSGATVADVRKAIEISESYLPKPIAAEISRQSREYYALDAFNTARRLLQGGDISATIAQIREGLKCSDSPNVIRSLAFLFTESEQLLRLVASLLSSTDIDQFSTWTSDGGEAHPQIGVELRDINLVIFPNWKQPEELVYKDLASAIEKIITHPERNRIKLWIDNSNISAEDADLKIADIAFNLLMEKDLDMTEEPAISLIGKLNEIEWKAILPQFQARIILSCENQQVVRQVGADKLLSFELQELEDHTKLELIDSHR